MSGHEKRANATTGSSLEHGWIIVHNSNPWGSFHHE